MRAWRALAVALVLAVAGLAPAAAAEVNKSDNVDHIRQFEYDGGTELAASGKFVYSGELDGDSQFSSRGRKPEDGGLHMFDVSGRTPKEVGFLHCPGNDNDVEVVKPGVVAVGHHVNVCNQPKEGSGNANSGVMLVDVRKPSRPRIVGSVNLPSGGLAHTIRPYPGKPFIYVNPGGLPTNGRMTTHIIDVSNPAKPKIAATFVPPQPPTGCHDFSFFISKSKQLGFCAGYGAFQVWDVSDPVKPEVISTVRNPQIQFNHYAVASSDGKLLAIDDEAFAFHECHTGQSPTGRVWIYDISDPTAPELASSFAPPRGGDGTVGHLVGWVPSWCLSHGLDWQPGTHNLAVTWFTGGVSVLDLSSPEEAEEVAFFQADDAATYSALWHKGLLFTNDMNRGVDVFKIKGLKK